MHLYWTLFIKKINYLNNLSKIFIICKEKMKSKNSSKKLVKTKIIENEIINDFNGKIKNRTNKLTFLKKYTITDLHVSK